ncbi:hypothetical protein Syun_031326 [Stephania yunnanensis]|uniref:Uncharacterized protein n=1 Tax=Stephania yunnanensis TaxID=152371 RepID=A0AAP0DW15_9MAGN
MLAYDYGKNLGLAYQLIDDVLDFTGTTNFLGKPSLLDIRHVMLPYFINHILKRELVVESRVQKRLKLEYK